MIVSSLTQMFQMLSPKHRYSSVLCNSVEWELRIHLLDILIILILCWNIFISEIGYV